MIIIAHGGAGIKVGEVKEVDILDDMELSSLKANTVVEKVVNELENDKCFNAGKGGKLQLDGEVRLDAGIMDENGFGAVINIDSIKNPISVAKYIKNKSNNNILHSNFAKEFALNYGFKEEDLRIKDKILKWEETKRKVEGLDYKEKIKTLRELEEDSGTVGCVALDDDGNLCAGTSTGGVLHQQSGRVGDSALPGQGYYCTSEIAISTTGLGEIISKVNLAKEIEANFNHTKNLKKSIDDSLEKIKEHGGFGGVIAVTKGGEYYQAHNADQMFYEMKRV